LTQNFDRRSDDRHTDRQTDASDFMICPMLCYSNGTNNYEYISQCVDAVGLVAGRNVMHKFQMSTFGRLAWSLIWIMSNMWLHTQKVMVVVNKHDLPSVLW